MYDEYNNPIPVDDEDAELARLRAELEKASGPPIAGAKSYWTRAYEAEVLADELDEECTNRQLTIYKLQAQLQSIADDCLVAIKTATSITAMREWMRIFRNSAIAVLSTLPEPPALAPAASGEKEERNGYE